MELVRGDLANTPIYKQDHLIFDLLRSTVHSTKFSTYVSWLLDSIAASMCETPDEPECEQKMLAARLGDNCYRMLAWALSDSASTADMPVLPTRVCPPMGAPRGAAATRGSARGRGTGRGRGRGQVAGTLPQLLQQGTGRGGSAARGRGRGGRGGRGKAGKAGATAAAGREGTATSATAAAGGEGGGDPTAAAAATGAATQHGGQVGAAAVLPTAAAGGGAGGDPNTTATSVANQRGSKAGAAAVPVTAAAGGEGGGAPATAAAATAATGAATQQGSDAGAAATSVTAAAGTEGGGALTTAAAATAATGAATQQGSEAGAARASLDRRCERWVQIGEGACPVHGFIYEYAVRAARLATAARAIAETRDTSATEEDPKRFLNSESCKRVLGWAVRSYERSGQSIGGQPQPTRDLLQKVKGPPEDSAQPKCFGPALLNTSRMASCVPQSLLL